MTIKVLIVDDSAVVREVLAQVLSQTADLEVIGTCSDPIFAQQKMKIAWPDVLVLDIEMPRMDGLTFLRQIMAERPTPVVICSSLTEKGATVTLDALSAGAVAIVTKPTLKLKSFLEDSATEIVHQVRAAAAARMTKVRTSQFVVSAERRPVTPKLTADSILPPPSGREPTFTTDRIIALGTSTGGTQALEYVLPRLPLTTPGIAVVQHMPAQFTASFARRLDSICEVEVKEAQTGDRLVPGVVLVAPGGRHLTIRRSNNQYIADVKDGPLVSRHRPSVDVLFRSVAIHAGRNAVGVIMTGMGDDGARGLREMHNAGARTIAQDEESSVVFGMPKEAIAHGGVMDIMSLDGIATMLSGMKT